jgi:hypothetical protein
MTEAFHAYSATKTRRPDPSVDRAPPVSGRPSRGRHSCSTAERDHAVFQRGERPHGNAARASTLSILHFSRKPSAPARTATLDLIRGVAVTIKPAVNIASSQAIRRSHAMLRERLYFLYFTLPA